MTRKLPVYIPPSAYTPFLRRFTDERALELAEIKQLYASVTATFRASVWAQQDIVERINGLIAEQVSECVQLPSQSICEAFDRCQQAVLSKEVTLFSTPIINDWNILTLKEQVELRRFLRAQEHFLGHEERVSGLLVTTLSNVFAGISSMIPRHDGGAQFNVPLYTLIDVHDVVDRIIGTLAKQELADVGLFVDLNDQLYRNICDASGLVPYEQHRRPFITASDSDLAPEELVDTYLNGTPLLELFNTPVPFLIPRSTYTEHAAIFAPTGHGKTQTLQNLILSFLHDDPPAMFIMDSMGSMLKKIERLSLFTAELEDRLVILDPTDERPPALNFFKMQGGSPAQQTALFFYLFKAIEQGLTQRQATMVAYLVTLMQSIPEATLDTLRHVCESRAQLYPVDGLEPIAQDFFTHQFYGKDPLINQTKQQIAARLYTVGRNPIFNQMFSAPENKFNAYACMQQKKIVLINTDRLFLGDEASGVFGRFVIAQCLAAALSRAPLPERDRHLALLIVDEAKAYFDDQTEKILSDARQFGLGLIFATQQPHQLPEGVRKEMYTNTAIKLIGPIDYSDRVSLSREMGTTPEFIGAMRSYAHDRTEFAAHVRNLTPHALKLTIPMGVLENEPRMSEESHRAIRARNRALYGAVSEAPKFHTQAATAAQRKPQPEKPTTPSAHKELKGERPSTSKKKPEQPETSSSAVELDTDH